MFGSFDSHGIAVAERALSPCVGRLYRASPEIASDRAASEIARANGPPEARGTLASIDSQPVEF
jgi:hypothetical protein